METTRALVFTLFLNYTLSTKGVQSQDGDPRITWFIHLSDIHLSKWWMNPVDPRERDLNLLFKNVISKINPATVLITGDLADSVNKHHQGQQYPQEWHAYNRVLNMILHSTNMKEIPDIRGNHDMYNVGCKGGESDYYPRFGGRGAVDEQNPEKVLYVDEINGQFGVKEVGCPSVVLLGMDLTPNPGFRGPTNFAALITKKLLKRLNEELQEGLVKYESCHNIITFIAYSHYPLCVATYIDTPLWQQAFNLMEINLRIEDLFAKYNVTAFLNGHLHNFFGERLHRLIPTSKSQYLLLNNHINEQIDGNFKDKYSKRNNNFMENQYVKFGSNNNMRGYIAELETADWMWSRRFRIMAIDDGTLSFQDHQYHVRKNGTSIASIESKFVYVQNFLILITHPADGRYSPLVGAKKPSDKLRALVFNIGDDATWKTQKRDFIVESFLQCEKDDEKINIVMNFLKEPVYEGEVPYGVCEGVGNITVLVRSQNQQQIDSFSSIPVKLSNLSNIQNNNNNQYPLPLDQTLEEYITLRVHWPSVAFWVFYAEHRRSSWRYPLLPIYYLCVFASCRQSNACIQKKQIQNYFFVNSPLPWKFFCAYVVYLGFFPWLLIRVLSEKQPGYAFPFGVVLRINQFLEYSPTPELLVVFSFQLIFVVFPVTLWLAWTYCTQYKKQNKKLQLTIVQLFVGFIIFYSNVRIIGLVVGWYDIMAFIISPGIGWFVPYIIFILYSINYELKNRENLGLCQVLSSVAVYKKDKLDT